MFWTLSEGALSVARPDIRRRSRDSIQPDVLEHELPMVRTADEPSAVRLRLLLRLPCPVAVPTVTSHRRSIDLICDHKVLLFVDPFYWAYL